MTDRPPLPPFDLEAALTKVQAAEAEIDDAGAERPRLEQPQVDPLFQRREVPAGKRS